VALALPKSLSIYKKGQGQVVRWSTVGSIWLLVGLGMLWLAMSVMVNYPLWARLTALAVMAVIGVLASWWSCNTPRTAEFMIMTESEMRKVVWPGKQQVIDSTKVVIVMTLLMALLLFGVDQMFHWIVSKIGLM